MDHKRHERVYRLFQLARGVAPEARAALLDAHCAGDTALRAQVERLLAQDTFGPTTTPTEPTAPTAPTIAGPSHAPASSVPGPRPKFDPLAGAAPAIPQRLGRYRILRVLGEGGMGTVYEAEQENPKRAVALKVIRAGYLSPQLLKRFEHESQVLARLQHPGIAQVYEAGVVEPHADDESSSRRASPIPFFAMEFIRGVSLTSFVETNHLGTRERLDLLARICDAVYHAHQKGVIHRDLKPGNILVDESGQPKILDFGVARATDSDIQQTTLQTDIGQLIGTVPYMSPEQVLGDPNELDTRSDVYALGVIAYELLAGKLPYDLKQKMIHEAARIIKEEEPTRLSSINRTLRGDVETIVAKALEKGKQRRYQSAESLASDIRRYLKDEPITARPASTWYQASKFARRNKGLVAGLGTAFVFLSAGLALALVSRQQAITARRDADSQKTDAVAARESEARQRKAAETQRDKAELIADFMSETLKGAAPRVARSRDITLLKDMLDTAAARIENGDLRHALDAELRLRSTIGNTYRELALFDGAHKMLQPAVALARSTHPGDHQATADALNNYAMLLVQRADLEGAEPLLREAVDIWRRLAPGDNSDLATGVNNLAILLRDRGDLAEAEPLLREALNMWNRLSTGDHPDVATGLNNLALLLRDRGDLAAAEPLFRESLEMTRRLFRGDHPDVATGLSSLGLLLQIRGELEAAEPLLLESLEMTRRLFHDDCPEVAAGLSSLALLLQDRGDLAAAEPLFRESLEMTRRLFTGDHPLVAQGLNKLGLLLQARADLAGAEPLFRESLEMARRLFTGDHGSVAADLNNLGLLLNARGDLAGAEPLVRESIEMKKRLFPGDHPDIARSLNNLAIVLEGRTDPAGAEPIYGEAAEMFARTLGNNHWLTAHARMGRGRVLTALNDFAAAEPELIEAHRVLSSAQGVPAGRNKRCMELLVTLYEMWDKAEPGKGNDVKAAVWKAKLDEIEPPPREPDGKKP